MSSDEREDTTIYKVVLNHEEQYSIWPADRENALGWTDAGKSGTKQECLDYIKEVWTDMRPLALRSNKHVDFSPIVFVPFVANNAIIRISNRREGNRGVAMVSGAT